MTSGHVLHRLPKALPNRLSDSPRAKLARRTCLQSSDGSCRNRPCHEKPRSPHSFRSVRVRIKPGWIIRLPPHTLDGLRWAIGDILCVTVAGGGTSYTSLPSEVAWRVDRPRLRTGSTAQVANASPTIRTYVDYLRLQLREKRTNATHRQPE